MNERSETNAAHSREHWPDYARCADPLCAPNLVCDDYINGRMVEAPDCFVECLRPGCPAGTPNVKSVDAAKAAWNAMMAAAYAPEEEPDR